MKGLMGLLASAALAFTVFAGGGALPKTKYPPLNETLFQMYFKKVEPSQLKGNVFDWVRKECFLVTAGSPASYNSMTAGWGGFGVLWGRDVASIYVRNTRYTYEFLEKEPYFTLSSAMEWPPAREPPASTTFSLPPRRISPRMFRSISSGKQTMFSAVFTSPPMA